VVEAGLVVMRTSRFLVGVRSDVRDDSPRLNARHTR
jgi:hypothetical protein